MALYAGFQLGITRITGLMLRRDGIEIGRQGVGLQRDAQSVRTGEQPPDQIARTPLALRPNDPLQGIQPFRGFLRVVIGWRHRLGVTYRCRDLKRFA